ncbi:HPr-rel-A system PqqD family peptide chaperone [Rugamonas sp. CCM 8940]|nr:HPr-rel-A system PqqD family peptide chaperone [Rugamonas sp. CCM 8940]
MWRMSVGQLAASRHWDDEFVVYNNLSGDTHLLGADAMLVLQRLQQGEADEAALLALLRDSAAPTTAAAPAAGHAELATELAQMLDDLRRLALIDTTPC